MGASDRLLILWGFGLLALVVTFVAIRLRHLIRATRRSLLMSESVTETNILFRLTNLKNQGDLLMGAVSSGVASVQGAIADVQAKVTQLQSDSAKAAASIQSEIDRVNTTIASLQGNPGDAAALAQALTDLNQVSSNLSAVSTALQSGATSLDAEDPAPVPTP